MNGKNEVENAQLNTAAFQGKNTAGCKESRDTQRGSEWGLLCSKSSKS